MSYSPSLSNIFSNLHAGHAGHGDNATEVAQAPTTNDVFIRNPFFFSAEDQYAHQWQLPIKQSASPIVVNFLATWCLPCREELPLLNKYASQASNPTVKIIYIALDVGISVQEINDFLGQVGINIPIVMAGKSGWELIEYYGNSTGSLPYSVMLNAKGKKLQEKFGQFSDANEISNFIKATDDSTL